MKPNFNSNALSFQMRLQVLFLLFIVSATAATILVTFSRHDRAINSLLTKVAAFHGPSTRHALEAKEAAHEMELHVRRGGDGIDFSQRSATLEHLLQREVDGLATLQEFYGGEEFAATIGRIRDKFTQFQIDLRVSDLSDTRVRDELLRSAESLQFSLMQLHELHRIAARESTDRASAQQASGYRALINTLLLISAVGAAVVIAILMNMNRLLKRTILAEDEQSRLEKELEEKRVLQLRTDRLRSLGEMASGIAHELNQPLMGVQGIADHLLLSAERDWEVSPAEMEMHLKKIREQADRMTYIVDHVRRFARKADTSVVEAVDINEVVEDGLDLLGAQFRSQGIVVDSETESELPLVRANKFSLEEVLINLLVNARDATQASRGTESAEMTHIRVRTYRLNGTGPEQVAMQVSDEGVGMSDEVKGRATEPFFTTKGPDDGTGLGLSISKSIVEECGGRLVIESVPGEGTSVSVIIPAMNGAEN